MRAWHLALGLWALACSPAPAPLAPPPRVGTPTTTTPALPPVTPLASATPLTAVLSPAEPAATLLLPAKPAEPPRVLIEPPYSALGHARLATEMLTLERDEELLQWALGGASDPQHPSNRPGYHPATRVVIDVELLSRAPHGATKRLQRIARSTGYWPLRACFETAQRLATKAERSARVRLTLGATGKVLGARSMGPTPDRDYARCALQRLRGLDFKPGFTRKLDIEISVRQWPGHAPLPPRAPEGTTVPRLSDQAFAALSGLASTLGGCYEKGLASDAKLWGRIAFRLQLAGDGELEIAQPVETRFPNAEVVECARQAVQGARVSSPGVSELTFAVRLGQGAPPAPAVGMPESPAPPPAPSQ